MNNQHQYTQQPHPIPLAKLTPTLSPSLSPRRTTIIQAVALIKPFEGLRLNAYVCPAGVWTIGYGHVIRDDYGRMFMSASHTSLAQIPHHRRHISAAQAERLLNQDITPLWGVVNSLFTVKLATHQRAALMSFAYNLGGGALRASTLRVMINQQRPKDIKREWQRWVFANGQKLQGLIKRRRAEVNIFFASKL